MNRNNKSSVACLLLIAFTFVAVIASLMSETSAFRIQKRFRCKDDSCPELEDCEYGIATDKSGYSICALGPGERCGSPNFPLHADCGDGMFCYCGRCMGCSTKTYTCYDKTCF